MRREGPVQACCFDPLRWPRSAGWIQSKWPPPRRPRCKRERPRATPGRVSVFLNAPSRWRPWRNSAPRRNLSTSSESTLRDPGKLVKIIPESVLKPPADGRNDLEAGRSTFGCPLDSLLQLRDQPLSAGFDCRRECSIEPLQNTSGTRQAPRHRGSWV